MNGQSPRFRHGGGGGGGRGTASPSQPQAPLFNYFANPNLLLQNPNPNLLSPLNPFLQAPNFPLHNANFPIQNPHYPAQNPNFPVRNPNFPTQTPKFPAPNPKLSAHQFLVQPQPLRPNEALERMDLAVVKARSNLLAAGESVSSWKVSQAALLILQADSWDSLGFQMQQVPSLHRLIVTEGKINAFIHCFIGVRRITSLYDLEMAICGNEGVERFEQIELGPLVRHPLVVHYFSVGSNVSEVFKITSEEIVSCLCEFVDTHKGNEVKVEELLDFIAKKRSVTGRDKLSVRIQSLGMHITHIRQARRSENTVLKKCLEGFKMKSGKKRRNHPLFSSQKKQLDDNFSSLSQRIKSFSSEHKDFSGKHIRFISSDSEDDDTDTYESEDNEDESNAHSQCKLSSQSLNSSDRVSSCPYPSAAEEMTRLGLKSDMDGSHSASGSGKNNENNGSSRRKRKSENISCSLSAPNKLPKRDDAKPDILIDDKKKGFSNHNEADFSLANNSMRMFITTWKEACRENKLDEVFERMLQFYKPRKRKQMRKLFMSYPCVGLLNVAVTSIKCGMWDSLYDTFQNFSQQDVANTISEKHTDYASIEVEPSAKDALLLPEHLLNRENDITVEEILNKVSKYFGIHHDTQGNGNPPLEKKFILLKKLCKCEFWLTEQFSVKEFESLGHGEFFMFLEKHVCLLPHALQKFLTGETRDKLSLEACMLQQQLDVLLSQALSSIWENENINKQKISELLTRQFPSVCFKLVETCSLKDFWDTMRENKSNVVSNCVLFSATLLGMGYIGDSSVDNVKNLSEAAGIGTDIGHKAGVLGSFTTKDTIEVLLRAPMLMDLDSWSHWDLIFSPSLGPLVAWLLNEVNTEELLCLVTKGGKVIRIDQLATMDSFLEALLQGSSFQTAVKLLSLFSLYGGQRNVPLSLLKCHARQGFEVIVKNSMETELNEGQSLVMHGGKPLCRGHIFNENASSNLTNKLPKNRNGVNNGVPAASRFILDCLGYLPLEFCSFAADVLLSGLLSVVKDAPAAILSECKQLEQRLMLHEVGLSLGIIEWISDYNTCSSTTTDLFMSSRSPCLEAATSEFGTDTKHVQDKVYKFSSSEGEMVVSVDADRNNEGREGVCGIIDYAQVSGDSFGKNNKHHLAVFDKNNNPAFLIESIRRDEFGLDPSLSALESNMLKKQHARLGRALHCLSQELYSQDSHFLLELVQNADDNVYPVNSEPTLTFILQKGGIIVLNNEQGFSVENIRALCDIGNSTKRGSSAGYIGKKGIGFKSVFRVTDAPEIHSNGFHIKFDISEGQIGFVLPTIVPPCDIDEFSRLASTDSNQMYNYRWNTCIVLPFKSKLSDGFAMNNIISMFSDLCPSLLLFLHRLRCIKFRNMVNDSLVVMRKEEVGDGIINVSLGKEKMTWLVVSQKLRGDVIRSDVQTTEVSIAFTLQESGNGDYIPYLDQQPVFAFLPLRMYGLKFILQGDFILPSSREEVDGDNPWNQWLLSEFPGLFVSAERSFCGLPCFKENPGKAAAAFMSFVPLVGEVHGFFSSLPRMIISKLRVSNCLLLEGNNNEWVPPCKVLRNWTEQAHALLPDSLLREHCGLGFLNKDTVLSDSLARALGIEDYGPKILLEIMSSLCRTENGLKSMGLGWLSCWINAIYSMCFHSSGQISLNFGTESDLIAKLSKISFIPLSDGKYGSVDEDTIWLHSDGLSTGSTNEYGPEAFNKLYANLRTVSSAFFSAAVTVDTSHDVSIADNLTRMLYKVGVQRLSAHDIVKIHILPAISDDRNTTGDKDLLIEYLSFLMLHLQSSCSSCCVEREYIISELKCKALISTNHGYKRLTEVPIHFSKDFGNPIDVTKLIYGIDMKWHEVDITYLKHRSMKSVSGGMMKWRKFFQELGVTDFVQIVQIEKSPAELSNTIVKNMMWNGDIISPGSTIKDWESQELVHLLSQLSSSSDQKRCKYLLEVLDTLWDDCFCDKVTGFCNINSTGESKSFKSSLISVLLDGRWIASNMDHELHCPKDLFHDCDAVRSILGCTAPYAVPKVRSEKLLVDIGFKTQVTLDDILSVLQVWRRSEAPFRASLSQMSKLYAFIWNAMTTSKQQIDEELRSGAFIFVPYSTGSTLEDVVHGVFLSPREVYWHDSTDSADQMRVIYRQHSPDVTLCPFSKMLCNIYPALHDFFVNECGVDEFPPFHSYLQILLQLSSVALPSQAAKTVFQVFLKWADGMKSGLPSSEDIEFLKESLLKIDFMVLPTAQDKWVSLNPSFGLVCWCDDEKLRKEFKHVENIDFLYFGELNDGEKDTLQAKVTTFMQRLGIPILSEVVTREAVYYGIADSTFKVSLVNWALPYAQRYIYNVYPDKYFQLKTSGFENLSRLRVVVVDKLFYKNVIKRSDIASKKRLECSCLLQDNILYVTQESDSHSIFMELSRLLVDGTPELHLANFLHMITTMAESGSTEEQTEFFILNSQKVPKLPDDESVWSLLSVSSSTENEEILKASSVSTMIDEANPSKLNRKPGISSNWPPVDWKTAPGFNFARANGFRTQASHSLQTTKGDDAKEIAAQTDYTGPIEIIADWTVEAGPEVNTAAVILQDSETLRNQSDSASNMISSSMNVVFDSVGLVTASNSVDLLTTSESLNSGSSSAGERDQLSFGTTNAQQALLTGRMGEFVAFKFFAGKVGETRVKWVNEANETGLPYDIVVGDMEKGKEYVEVKATKSGRKDWFLISAREWQFAVEKGESFSIAHVVLLGNKMARVTIYKNPARLCQLGKLQLAVVMPKQQKEFPTVS